jgi:hypothetical protein
MRFFFVSRARFEDREKQILELKQELVELKFEHARVLDEIVFRSTGFHTDPRFATAAAPAEAAPTQPVAPAEELTGVARAISEVGTRPTAVRRYLENASLSELEKTEAAARKGREVAAAQEAARRMNEVLEKTKPQAATA